MKFKTRTWVCKKYLRNGIDYLCESKDGKRGVSLLDDGKTRVVRFDSAEIRVEGKRIKDKMGVDVE